MRPPLVSVLNVPANAVVRGASLSISVTDSAAAHRGGKTIDRLAESFADDVSGPAESADLWADPERPSKRLSRAEIARRWLFPCYGAQANARDATQSAAHRAYLRDAARGQG